MKSIFDPAARAEVAARFRGIPPDRRPHWGQMDAPRMLCHVSDALRVAVGDLPAKSKQKRMFTNPVMRYLAIYVLPWPKGTPTAPEMLSTVPASWDADMDGFVALLERAAALGPGGKWAPHPLFGNISGKTWGDLAWRHLDHHLRQFGA
ncbi:MAG TPA: DUF1569 domain-containing protein [Longimicrobium sp.]|nr:DUF1569 domain-containing protein [Longimicrobium sp.]